FALAAVFAFSYMTYLLDSVVMVEPPVELEHTGDRDEDVRVNMQRIAEILERYIIEAPDQWVVLQKIWDKDYTEEKATGNSGRNGHSTENVPAEQKEPASTF
ncbi:MAG TPA: hypothetical protein VLQ48_08620, partial [Chloroflexia bacterium]|nr:hypothetical protein [Chloroflexia bacterium]